MNRTYRLVKNRASGATQVVAESARASRGSGPGREAARNLLCAFMLVGCTTAFADGGVGGNNGSAVLPAAGGAGGSSAVPQGANGGFSPQGGGGGGGGGVSLTTGQGGDGGRGGLGDTFGDGGKAGNFGLVAPRVISSAAVTMPVNGEAARQVIAQASAGQAEAAEARAAEVLCSQRMGPSCWVLPSAEAVAATAETAAPTRASRVPAAAGATGV
ncbi:MAG: ESPR-type extended signal peptide-containing protein [Variovorax sp.]